MAAAQCYHTNKADWHLQTQQGFKPFMISFKRGCAFLACTRAWRSSKSSLIPITPTNLTGTHYVTAVPSHHNIKHRTGHHLLRPSFRARLHSFPGLLTVGSTTQRQCGGSRMCSTNGGCDPLPPDWTPTREV